MKHIAIVLSI